jgi:hypothetical protein
MGRVSILLVSAIAQLTALTGVIAEPVHLSPRAAPTVDLGYAVYQGTYDANSQVNSFKGYVALLPIRFTNSI